MAEIIRFVNTDAAAGGDGTTSGVTGATRGYATLAEWESSEQTDLVSDGDNHVVKCLGSTIHTSVVTIGGWTTSDVNDIEITVHEERRHNGISGVSDCIISSTPTTHVFNVAQDHVEISYFEIFDWQGNSSEAFRITGNSGVFHHIIAHNAIVGNQDVFYPQISSASGNVQIYNCIGNNIQRCFFNIQNVTNLAAYIYNCTATDAGDGDANEGHVIGCDPNTTNTATTIFCKNVVASGRSTTNLTFRGGGGGGVGCENCASNDESSINGSLVSNVGGNISGIIIEDQFISTATSGLDFHLAANALILGSGLDLSSDANLAFTDDIDGITRTAPWDIGADQRSIAIEEAVVITTFVSTFGVNPSLQGIYRAGNGIIHIPKVDTIQEVISPIDEQLVFIEPSGRLAIFHTPSGWMLSEIGTLSVLETSGLFFMGVGAITESGFDYRIRSSGPSQTIAVEYSINDDLSSSTTSAGSTTVAIEDNTGGERLTDLSAATIYFYNITIDGLGVFTSPFPSFRTAPSGDIDTETLIAFGSCQLPASSGQDDTIFQFVSGDIPDLFLHLGDFNYPDTRDIPIQRESYQTMHNESGNNFVSGVIHRMAIERIWDDHDMGLDNGDRHTPDKGNSLQVWKEYTAHYDLEQPASGQWRQFTYGNAEFFMIDCRYQRTPNTDTLRFPTSSTNIADGGSSASLLQILSADSPSGADGTYNEWYIKVSGEVAKITNWTGASRLATLSHPLTGLASGSDYFIGGVSILDGAHLESGVSQVNWLVNGVNDSTKKWKFIVSPVIFNANDGTNDSWSGHDPDDLERDYLVQHISGWNTSWITGDRHYGAIDDGTNSDFPEITAGSLIQTANTGTDSFWSHNATAGKNNYGLVHIETTPRHQVTFTLRDMGGSGIAGVDDLTISSTGDFDPTYTSGLVFWLDASQDTSHSHNDAVATAADFGPSGIDGTQSVEGEKPTYVTGVVNGLPAYRFDGDNALEIDGAVDIFANEEDTTFTFLAIFKQANLTNNQNILGVGQSDDAVQAMTIRTRIDGGAGSDDVYGIRKADDSATAKTAEGGTPDATSWSLLQWRYTTDGTVSMWRNGSGIATAVDLDVGTFTADLVRIGALERTTEARSLEADVAECILFDNPIGSQDRRHIQEYIGIKYGIVMSGGV